MPKTKLIFKPGFEFQKLKWRAGHLTPSSWCGYCDADLGPKDIASNAHGFITLWKDPDGSSTSLCEACARQWLESKVCTEDLP